MIKQFSIENTLGNKSMILFITASQFIKAHSLKPIWPDQIWKCKHLIISMP